MGCERQVLRFGSEESLGYDAGFPICCLEITPVLAKFSDTLTHRDYLGALMNLGIERNTLGDIMIQEKTAYLFCLEKVAAFIVENLSYVKHTNIRIRLLEEMPDAIQPKKKQVMLIVPSMRYDVVIAKMCHLSRSQSIALFREKKIFVNGRVMENNSGTMKENDVVSVRGYGKFVCEETLGETRKGNLSLRVSQYV
jgi:RNA-binding protein YlmH